MSGNKRKHEESAAGSDFKKRHRVALNNIATQLNTMQTQTSILTEIAESVKNLVETQERRNVLLSEIFQSNHVDKKKYPLLVFYFSDEHELSLEEYVYSEDGDDDIKTCRILKLAILSICPKDFESKQSFLPRFRLYWFHNKRDRQTAKEMLTEQDDELGCHLLGGQSQYMYIFDDRTMDIFLEVYQKNKERKEWPESFQIDMQKKDIYSSSEEEEEEEASFT